jgi:hypothetical protein
MDIFTLFRRHEEESDLTQETAEVSGGLGEIMLSLLSQNLASPIFVCGFVSPFFPHEDPQRT